MNINEFELKLSCLCPVCNKEIFIYQDYAQWFHQMYHTECLMKEFVSGRIKEVNRDLEKQK